MAQPVIEEILTPQVFDGDDDDPLVINLPATLNTGEKVFVVIGLSEPRYNGPPTGWTTEIDVDGSTSNTLIVLSRTIDETEGASISVNLTSPSRAIAIVIRVSGFTDYEFGTTLDTTDGSPNPPSVTFSWGSADTLVIPIFTVEGSATEQSLQGYPANYTSNQTSAQTADATSDDVLLALATREVTASSEDPGTFSLESAAFNWIATTLAIQGTGVSDTTDPTPGNSGTFDAATNIDQNSFDANWTKGTDDTSAPANLRYYVYASLNNDIDTVSNAEVNGELQNAGGTLDIDTLTIDCTTLTGYQPGDRVYYQVVLEDEASNKAAYTMNSVVTQRIFGNVDIGGVDKQNVDVIVLDLDTLIAPTTASVVEILTTDVNGDFIMTTEYDRTKNYLLAYILTEEASDSGTAESGTITTLTDTDKSWTPDEWIDANQPYFVRGTGGTNSGYLGRIIDNDADTLTVQTPAGSAFDATSQYEIVQTYVQTQIAEALE